MLFKGYHFSDEELMDIEGHHQEQDTDVADNHDGNGHHKLFTKSLNVYE
jgi:hypothetical protein